MEANIKKLAEAMAARAKISTIVADHERKVGDAEAAKTEVNPKKGPQEKTLHKAAGKDAEAELERLTTMVHQVKKK